MNKSMNKLINYAGLAIVTAILSVVFLSGAAFGQSDNPKLVGIDPSKNTVQLPNTPENPLSVKVENTPARKPFQKRIIVQPLGTGFQTVFMEIPAGKRLVIENISAIVRCPEGLRMEFNYFTYYDNEGNGDGGIADITFHRIALTDQGVFDGTSILTANHKVLVFADEKIGTISYQVGVQARLSAMPPANSFSQAQITFSGYLEDLPTAP